MAYWLPSAASRRSLCVTKASSRAISASASCFGFSAAISSALASSAAISSAVSGMWHILSVLMRLVFVQVQDILIL